MDFSIEFEEKNSIIFDFFDGECEPLNLRDDEPEIIRGTITCDDHKIGYVDVYKLDNDSSFYRKCDNFSDDSAMIAEAICDENGCVLEKFLPSDSFWHSIFILDRIYIDKEFRGKGIGSAIISNLLNMLNYQYDFCCAVFLSASAFETADEFGPDSQEYIDECRRLDSFYKKNGFVKVENNIYVCKNNTNV